MKFFCLALVSLVMNSVSASVEVIYGEDNRLDVYQNSNRLHAHLARSTAGMINLDRFGVTGNKNLFNLLGVRSLERAQNICPSELFADQPVAANCSGFLVGEDLLVTAGHCYRASDTPENNCKNFAWVFNFEMKSANDEPTKNISIDDIYLCKEVVASRFDETMDFAIIRLDRKVPGRRPLRFRKTGKLRTNTPLVVIGHPTGLPKKITPGGAVTHNKEAQRFATSLDTFHGNSGSAVFDANSGVVQGILIMGKTDYQPSIPGNPRSCLVVNRCDDRALNCTAGPDQGIVSRGEIVLRIETIASLIQAAL